MSMFMSPSVVSMWASIGSADTSSGAPVMIRFILILCGGAPPCPLNSSRMAVAASSHSALRNFDNLSSSDVLTHAPCTWVAER